MNSAQSWKDSGAAFFQPPLRIPANRSATPGSVEAITPRQIWRPKMIRHSLLAVAASLMTLASFGGTVAIMNGGSASTVQVA